MEDYKIKIINRHVGKIKVIVPYNPIYIKKMKDIKGHRWNPEEKCWFFPKSDNIIEQLIDIFKDEDMWIDPSLRKDVGQTFRFAKEPRLEDLRREMVSENFNTYGRDMRTYSHIQRYMKLSISSKGGVSC